MPCWDFKCPKCGKTTEAWFPRFTLSKVICTDCNLPMERQPSCGSFVLKGSGFHVNDYPKR